MKMDELFDENGDLKVESLSQLTIDEMNELLRSGRLVGSEYRDVVCSVEDQEKRTELILDYGYLMIGGRRKGVIGEAIATLTGDDKKAEIMRRLIEEKWVGMNGNEVCDVIVSMEDDDKKLVTINEWEYRLGSAICDAVVSIDADDKKRDKLHDIYETMFGMDISTIICSMKDDNVKIELLEEYHDKMVWDDICAKYYYDKEWLKEYQRKLTSENIGSIIKSINDSDKRMKMVEEYTELLDERMIGKLRGNMSTRLDPLQGQLKKAIQERDAAKQNLAQLSPEKDKDNPNDSSYGRDE